MPKIGQGAHAPQKPKDMKKSLGKLFRYLKAFAPLIFTSIALMIASTVFRLIGPNRLGKITTIISKSVPMFIEGVWVPGTPFEMSQIWPTAIFLISIYVLGAIFTYVANVLIGKVCFKMSKKLRSDIQTKINKLPLSYLDRKPYGEVLSTVVNDVDTIGQTLHSSVSTLVGSIVLFIGSLIMMFVKIGRAHV